MSKNIFTDSDKEAIKKAVAELEKESSGELVLYYAKNSDAYVNANWKFSGIIALSFSIIVIGLSYFWLLPAYYTPIVMGVTILSSMVFGYLIAFFIPFLRYAITGKEIVSQRVLTKAKDMFLQEQVFNTVDRTGILIYISALEHQVVVLGDNGINAKIEQSDWEHVVALVVNGIKDKAMTKGIINAIDACKILLLDNGFIIKPGDTNELHDSIRIEG